MRAWLWETFKPPSGRDARRVVMAFTALVMAGRFGLAFLTSPGSASRINIIPAWQYGVVYLALLLALWWTLDSRRLTMAGFVTSLAGVGIYAVQAFDVYPVFPSWAYYGLMSLILLAEGAIIWMSLRRANR